MSIIRKHENLISQLGVGLTLLLIIVLAAYLRLVNLPDNPGWYSDEGTILDIAHHLLDGEWQYLAINQSTLIAARLPLFPLLVAGAMRFFGPDIATLRLEVLESKSLILSRLIELSPHS